MRNSAKVLLYISGACLCIMFGMFIGQNTLQNYFLPTYTAEGSNSESEAVAQGKININTASVSDLVQLPGLGETTAERIVAYRQQNGSFASVEDLLNVEGIGYGTLYNIHELITTGG